MQSEPGKFFINILNNLLLIFNFLIFLKRCTAAAWILDLRSYLFGDTPDDVDTAQEAHEGNDIHDLQEDQEEEVEQPQQPQPQPQRNNDEGLAAAHQALLQREGPLGYQPYTKPKMFPLLVNCL